MRKRGLAMGLTALMTAGLLTGCVSGQTQTTETTKVPEQKETTAKDTEANTKGAEKTSSESSSEDVVTLELFWQKSNTNVIQEIIDKFEAENPNIKIELTATSSDTGKQIFQTRMATNEPMDLVQHWPSQAEFRAMCKEGRMVDLSDYAWNDNIIDTYYDMSTVDGKLYSVPFLLTQAL